MRKIIAAFLIALAVPFTFRCVGGFGLTKKLHHVATNTGNKWLNWLVFLVFAIFQIYTICLVVDAIVINSIEFWTGSKPLGRTDYDGNGEAVRTQTQGDERAVYTYRKYGEELVIRTYKNEKLVKSLLLNKNEPGILYAYDSGSPVRIEAITQLQGDNVRVTILEGSTITGVRTLTQGEYADAAGKAQEIAAKYAAASSF